MGREEGGNQEGKSHSMIISDAQTRVELDDLASEVRIKVREERAPWHGALVSVRVGDEDVWL